MLAESEISIAHAAIALCLGIGLSSACGFRLFVPMLTMSLSAKAGILGLSEGWEWMASWPALIVFLVATVAEVGGYFFPWFDNLLDTVATPAALIAGTVLTAAMLGELEPMWQWSLAAIAGGGSAGTIKGGMGLVRAGSTATTGGIANPLVSIGELAMSLVMSVLAVVVPILAGLLAVLIVAFVIRTAYRMSGRLRRSKPAQTSKPAAE